MHEEHPRGLDERLAVERGDPERGGRCAQNFKAQRPGVDAAAFGEAAAGARRVDCKRSALAIDTDGIVVIRGGGRAGVSANEQACGGAVHGGHVGIRGHVVAV